MGRNSEEENSDFEVVKKDTNTVEQTKTNNALKINPQEISLQILLHEEKTNKNKKMGRNKKKEFEINDIENQDGDEDDMFSFYEGDFILREDETIGRQFTIN